MAKHRIVYALTVVQGRNGSDDTTIWDRVGYSMLNRDGSETVVLRSIPLSGRLQLRLPKEQEAQETEQPDADAPFSANEPPF